MKMKMKKFFTIRLVVVLMLMGVGGGEEYEYEYEYESAIGDPGMKRDGLRVAIEAWNQCNEVHEEAPNMGSPRHADCFDLIPISSNHSPPQYKLGHKVSKEQNKVGIKEATIGGMEIIDVNKFAAWKEVFLGQKCKVKDHPRPWHFWMIMLKSGNMDTRAAICPKDGRKSQPFPPEPRFPCFGKGCMNMPLIYHNYTRLRRPPPLRNQRNQHQHQHQHQNSSSSSKGGLIMKGGFFGTWDLDADIKTAYSKENTSFYSVSWEKRVGQGSWIFRHVLKTSPKYPWLMLYLRSDATTGLSGGYHYPTRGMTKIVPRSPNFKVRFTLDIKKGGGNESQFYLMDIGSCWKNNGKACDGDVTSDVTRYSEMIINPSTEAWCTPKNLKLCPPYHTFSNGSRVHRSDEARFPYDAYHVYCSPGNAKYLEEPYNLCDAYSNPQPQEILQILPHPVWGEYGYPTKKGQGWIGDPTTWELDVGALSHTLYFYQDPGSGAVVRQWPSIDVGTEIYVSGNEIAEWSLSNFDILLPKN